MAKMKFNVWCPQLGEDFNDGLKIEAESPLQAAELWGYERYYEMKGPIKVFVAFDDPERSNMLSGQQYAYYLTACKITRYYAKKV